MEVLTGVGAKRSGALVSYSGAFHPPQTENQMSFLLCGRRMKCVMVYSVLILALKQNMWTRVKESGVTAVKLTYEIQSFLNYGLCCTVFSLQCISL